MDIPERIYCVCFLGSLHSGKTSMIDYLVEETYPDFYSSPDKQPRFTDTREDERLREISIKTKPISLALEYQHKHYLFHIIDTPGHSNFIDEAMSGLRLADGAFLVVDVIEGVLKTTEIYI